MRKIVVLTFVTLDGVMQAPGGPGEDTAGAFTLGGWTVGYWDDFLQKAMTDQMGQPYDLLLGRKTYDIFAGYWPKVTDDQEPGASGINKAKKYVVTNRPIPVDWENTIRIEGDVVEEIKRLKKGDGPEIQVHGSSNLIQTLLGNDLVDELRLKIFPVTLGKGKRLFGEGTSPAGFELIESRASPSGVIVATYRRAGAIKSGSF